MLSPGDALLLARRVARRLTRDTPITSAEDYEGIAALAILESGTDDAALAWVVAKRSIIDQYRATHGKPGSARKAAASVAYDDGRTAAPEVELREARLLLAGLPSLTAREATVIDHVANGARVREIAEADGVGTETIKTQLDTARKRLGARTTAHAVALAIALGEIDAPTIRPRAVSSEP